jgi:hypothetical protein
VQILAEREVSYPWGLRDPLEWMSCEASAIVDDLVAGTATGRAFVQAKRTVNLSRKSDSHLASALSQFVRAYVSQREETPHVREVFDPEHGRFVLAAGSGSPASVTRSLGSVLEKIRLLSDAKALAEAAGNAEERNALKVICDHLSRLWEETTGSPVPYGELRQLLRLIYVQEFAVEAAGEHEIAAKEILRRSVLEDPDQADAAWSKLVDVCVGMIARRENAGRSGLQAALLKARIPIRAARSYRADIERLRQRSSAAIARLASYGRLQMGQAVIMLDRPYPQAIRAAAEDGPLAVVGEPGVGKSGSVYTAVEILQAEGRDTVVLLAEETAAESLPRLTEDLRLQHDLLEVLEGWPGDAPAFLVIDALDAARSEMAAAALRDLIRGVIERRGRWRVIASVREYDLRYGPALQDLFRGEPPPGPAPPLIGSGLDRVRHLVIGRLGPGELNQLASQSPLLGALVTHASPRLQELLTSPFNLHLAADLLDGGMPAARMGSIRSQVELLDRYWDARVLSAGRPENADTRELVLHQVVRTMVASRTLRVDRMKVMDGPASAKPLTDLLRAHVLAEWRPAQGSGPQRAQIAFPHHLLFDFAVARVYLRGSASCLVSTLREDPHLVLLIRPSLVLHFHYLWDLEGEGRHAEFWEAVLAICADPGIRTVGKLVGPTVAAESAERVEDFEPLFSALGGPNPRTRAAAGQALHYTVGAVLAAGTHNSHVVGPDAGPWCALIEHVTRNLREETYAPVWELLKIIGQRSDELTSDQLRDAGLAARRILEYEWRTGRAGSRISIEAVIRTFDGDPAGSATLVRRMIEPEHVAQVGYAELPWLSFEIKRLLGGHPELVREIYLSVFRHTETDDAHTYWGGIIMRLGSTRKQDYEGVLYSLREVFPAFLKQAPREAVRTLLEVLHLQGGEADGLSPEETFVFGEHTARFRGDPRPIWNRELPPNGEKAEEMLEDLESYLGSLVQQDGGLTLFRDLLELLVRENQLSSVWRVLLRVGTRSPDTLGPELAPLAWARPVLVAADTTTEAGEFIRSVSPHLPPSDRERIERTILSIPEGFPDDRWWGRRIRDRLLGCLVDTAVVTEDARRLLDALRARDAIPPNEDREPRIHWRTGSSGNDDYLTALGVPAEEAPNARIRQLEEAASDLLQRLRRQDAGEIPLNDFFNILNPLHLALERSEADGVHPIQREHSRRSLISGCADLAERGSLDCTSAVGRLVRAVLLAAADATGPESNTEANPGRQYLAHLAHEARRSAAKGLTVLAATCADEEVLRAIHRLSNDPDRSVREHLAHRLHALAATAPDLLWQIANYLTENELKGDVLDHLIKGALWELADVHPDQVADLVIRIRTRVGGAPKAETLRKHSATLLVGQYVRLNHPTARAESFRIAADPVSYQAEARALPFSFRGLFLSGPVSPPERQADVVRHRWIKFVSHLTESAAAAFHSAMDSYRQAQNTGEEPGEDVIEQLRSSRRVLEAIGANIWYAVDRDEPGAQRVPPQDVLHRLDYEIGPVLDRLADVGAPELAHHLAETQELLLPVNPRGAFLRLARIITGGRWSRYHHDPMADRLVVSLVERFLADYRSLLQQDEECRTALLEVLDTFVEAGSLEAHRLVYGLDEIFR